MSQEQFRRIICDTRKPPSKKNRTGLETSVDRFTVDFLRQVFKGKKEYIFFSPIGIIMLYTILLEGARGKTAKQIMQVFHLEPTFNKIDEVRMVLKKLIKRLNRKDEDLTIRMANKMVLDRRIKFKSSYNEILKKNYSASIDHEVFSPALTDKVNRWIAQETNNLIPKMFDETLDPPFLLINVLYYKGSWLICFEPSPKKDYFHNYDGTKSVVKMMYLEDKSFDFVHLEDEKLKIIRLLYSKNVSMYIFLPLEEGAIQTFIDHLEGDEIDGYIQSMTSTKLSLVKMPMFEFEDNHKLHEILPKMGLTLPFSSSANFTGMTDDLLEISESAQKTKIIVDEKGTEFAAVTYAKTIIMGFKDPPPKPSFIADRPFILFIRDEKTSVNLFVGAIKKFPNSDSNDSN